MRDVERPERSWGPDRAAVAAVEGAEARTPSASSRAPAPLRRGSAQLRVDWPACRARGLCAELVPELVALDEWGYPVVEGLVPRALLAHAAEAVDACPHRALRLVDPPAPR